jgi:Ca-activated chloride channel family protein
MLEKRRANEIYAEIKRQTIDPGILQVEDENAGPTVFSARVFPIPAWGTKRVEIEYTQTLAVENFSSRLSFPLKPSFGAAQRVGNFNLSVCASQEFPFSSISYDAENFPLRVTKQTGTEFTADFHAENYTLDRDFALDYRLDVPNGFLSFIAYRATETISVFELRDPALARRSGDGFFELAGLFNEPAAAPAPRRLTVLLDTSLSMAGEKLRRAVEAVDFLLHSLASTDEFSLILFSSEPRPFAPAPLPATPENIENALGYVRDSSLGGATDLNRALAAGVAMSGRFSAGEKSLVLVSDANATLGTTGRRRIESIFDGPAEKVKLYAFGVGSDAETGRARRFDEKDRRFLHAGA